MTHFSDPMSEEERAALLLAGEQVTERLRKRAQRHIDETLLLVIMDYLDNAPKDADRALIARLEDAQALLRARIAGLLGVGDAA